MNNFISFNDFQSSAKLKQEPKLNKTLVISQKNLVSQDTVELNDKLKNAQRKNGIIEKIADKIKGLTGLGFSSKKIQAKIENKTPTDEVNKDIKNYQRQQENIAQTTADVVSGLAGITVFFKLKQQFQLLIAKFVSINKDQITENIKTKMQIAEILNKLKDRFGKFNFVQKLSEDGVKDFLTQKLIPGLEKQKTAVIIGAIGAGVIAGLVKSNILKINRLGSKEFKLDKEKTKDLSRKEKRALKKELKKSKRSTDRRNKLSGILNGLTAPLAMLGVPGAIGYVALNSLSRYFIASKTDKGEKSIKSYVENVKNSPITNAVGALALLIPAIKSGKADKIFNENLQKAIEKLKNATFEKAYSAVSTYDTLEEILMGDEKIASIMQDKNLSTSEKIQKLSDENIFALKFKQIRGNEDELAQALKTDCPPTRTIEEADKIIKKSFGEKYTIKKCVGVGTVAESYIAADKDGKEVCIKMLKEGISAEKIAKDKEAFIQMIQSATDKSQEEKEFLIKNLENIAEGVSKEVDFTNEMKAAQALKKVTHSAKVVVPIEVKDNLYVMEKANGISLQELMKQIASEDSIRRSEGMIKYYSSALEEAKQKGDQWDIDFYSRQLEYYKQELEELSASIKKSEIGQISKDEAKKLLRKYKDVLLEQFNEVDEKGKIIHGDIHPGNIFIDIPAMRRGEKVFFTLIDTGNTINQSSENAIRFMNLTKYLQNADVDNIANFVLEGAKLPEGMSKEKAFEMVASELKKVFFDDKTKLGIVTNDGILNITSAIMQELNIIPSDTQGNLLKAKISANQSYKEFLKAFFIELGKQFENRLGSKEDPSKLEIMGAALDLSKEMGSIMLEDKIKTKAIERANLAMMSPALKLKLLKGLNIPAKNSEEYLIYLIKQWADIKNMNPEDVMKSLGNTSISGL